MPVLLIIICLLFVVWVTYGRGAYIVYKHKKDEGVVLPENMDTAQFMEMLKKNLGYKDAKEIFFDEDGEICIAGKYDTYSVQIQDGRVYVDDPLYIQFNMEKSKTVSFLANLGNFRIRSRKKKDRFRVEEIECIRAYVAKVFDHNAPVNPYKKYSNMKRAQKYSIIVSVICIALVLVLFAVSLSNGAENQAIDAIKYSYFDGYSSDIRIGEALDDFFANPTWETYFENGKTYVKFHGELLYYDEPALAVITFEFMEQDWFRASRITINGYELDEYECDEFWYEIYYSYGK